MSEQVNLVDMKENIPAPLNYEAAIMNLPQEECPVVHRFGPGVYIREVSIPARTMAIGHGHKHPHLNVLLKGSIAMPGQNGERVVLTAPFTYTCSPGRKIGYVLEDLVWWNIYATEETDIVKLEEMFLDKSEESKDFEAEKLNLDKLKHEIDRDDFLLAIERFGFTAEEVHSVSIDESDMVDMPADYLGVVTVRESPIAGKGIFCSSPIKAGFKIVPGSIDNKRTIAGRYANHAESPNAEFIKDDNGVIWLEAIKDIAGCKGGDAGEEVTVCYRQGLLLQGLKEVNHV
jgi:hypothetical protein